ncbi:hypothetical protein UMM65_10430 [Aureibaculum sp. 2210JD6-5]|uniref:DUF6892 domain-containing protein n=1 Tax=Aureibaculum sp. 2210JD6-5 TaxID=3103957 RepID=UPI002AAD4283|nr:hypothetical protein [Aureibaculum sp. 2210JD6-5]MDY7395659.1 hypothetical protein [Aureibaculum sp. 2210JD6-5]
MLNLFKKNKLQSIRIDCFENQLKINGIPLTFPTNYDTLVNIFGEPSKIGSTKLTNSQINCWNESGLYCDYSSSQHILMLCFVISKNHKLELAPKQLFKGNIFIEGQQIYIDEISKTKFQNYTLNKLTYRGESKPYAISFMQNFNAKKEIPKDKYLQKELKEEHIEFEDFGFKLSIVQELMYNQELLKPKFDLNEFAEWYSKRKIDIEEEGYDPIPEVTQYFKKLQIPKNLASEITEIYQDGGNDIYLNLLRFGDGTEDYWDIKSIRDAKKFPNLKKATLCYAKENVVDELNEMGIKSQWL